MAGQGYHFGIAALAATSLNREFTQEMKIGVLLIDALNRASGCRRRSHFTGGAGCLIPRYHDLRQITNIQSWDSKHKRSYIVDPRVDMRLFEAANIHITEGDYKDGIRMHLLGDRYYDILVQRVLFDVSKQKEGIIVSRNTHEIMDGAMFRKEIYGVYPMLDQIIFDMAGITSEDIENAKELVSAVFNDEMSSFICKYLNFREGLEWKDSKFFKREYVQTLVQDAVKGIKEYLTR